MILAGELLGDEVAGLPIALADVGELEPEPGGETGEQLLVREDTRIDEPLPRLSIEDP